MRRLMLICAVMAACAAAQDFVVEKVMVPMRDGIKLATDIYRPAAQGKASEGNFPALVTRSPYNKNGERRRGEFFASHGYVFVAQDTRGTHASEGEPYPLVHEGRDGYDTIEWAAAQPWSNGNIGTTGASYLAMDQYAAAIEQPPHLVAMYAAVGSENFYYDSAYHGGIPSLGWPVWLLLSAASYPHADKATADRLNAMVKNPDEWLSEPRDQRAKVFQNFPVQLRAYRDFYAHPTFDDYWKQTGFDTADYYGRMKDVPIYFVSGWYDSFAEATLQNFAALSRMQKSEKRLLMGPWPHGYGKSKCGEVSFGPEAELDENSLQLDWFDHWMRDKPYRVIGREPVRYFLMGVGWKTASTWPPADAIRSWRIDVKGGAYDYDPQHPVHTLGGRNGPECIQNQTVVGPDILTTVGPPLDAPLNLTGKSTVTLWVSSDAPSADFMVKLIDVAPNGFAAPLLDSAQRVDFKNKGPQRVIIPLGNTSYLLPARHRVRVDVTSSSFPKYEPNPHKAHNVIYGDAQHRSFIEIPVMGQ